MSRMRKRPNGSRSRNERWSVREPHSKKKLASKSSYNDKKPRGNASKTV